MTGKELIVYILQNDLEDKPVIKNGRIMGFLTAEEAAVKMNVGPATVKISVDNGLIPGYKLKSGIYIPVSFKM